MLEFERGERPPLVAAIADEARDRADVRSARCASAAASAPASKSSRWTRTVAIERQPPVIGGKKATSFAPAIAAPCRAWTLSSAARTIDAFSKA